MSVLATPPPAGQALLLEIFFNGRTGAHHIFTILYEILTLTTTIPAMHWPKRLRPPLRGHPLKQSAIGMYERTQADAAAALRGPGHETATMRRY
jgi:hypothetical protein